MHISDLHLGNDLIPRAIRSLRCWWKYVDKNITTGLTKAIRNLRPDYIVVSGDIVNKCRVRSFRAAAAYLRNLFLDANFDINEKLLIVPGNHDVSFFPRKQPDDFIRLRQYRKFLCALFNESDVEARRQRFSRTDPKARLVFFCVDSTLKDSPPLAEGQVGPSQREWLRRKVERLTAQLGSTFEDYAKIAVLHHHCLPIAGTTGERFMHLLDAGDVLKLFDELGINVVSHGHKHYPHIKPHLRSDSSVLTVIGAGTTTCRYLEEQNGMGNNFNWVTVSPELNNITIQLYRADQNGEFAPSGQPRSFPLFRKEHLGYSAKCVRKVAAITEDGTKTVTTIKEGLRVEAPGTTLRALPIRIFSTVEGSKIVDFDCDRKYAEPRFAAKSDTVIEGSLVLNEPLTYSSPPVTISYYYTLKGGTAMSQKELKTLYPPDQQKEGSRVIVTHPMRQLKIEVVFPKRFTTVPSVHVEHLGTEIPLDRINYSLNHDDALNRWELEVSNPALDHIISMYWSLPKNWP